MRAGSDDVAAADARAVGLPPALRRALAALGTLALLSPPAVVAQEAEQEGVELRLLRQTPAGTPDTPVRVIVEATNHDAPALRDLTVSLTIYHPARSRSAYQLGLEAEPPTAPLLIDSFRERGALRRGESREISIRRRLSELADEGENALYPMKVQLESEGVPVAVLRTVLPFIQAQPLVPLNLSLAFVLSEETPFGPDGTFLSSSLEASIAPGGRLDGLMSALEESPIRSTLVVSPLLLEHLAAMSDGYRIEEEGTVREVPPGEGAAARAADMLRRIRALARSPSTEVVALPYGAPSVSSLVASGLEDELARQIDQGREAVEEFFGVAPSTTVARPGSHLTAEAVAALEELGVETLLVNHETLPPPRGLTLSPQATATIHRTSMQAITPDPGTAAYLDPTARNPRLQAQLLLGELSAMYFERPSEVRGASLLFDERAALSPSFLRTLLRPLADPPADSAWLEPKTATQLITAVPAEDRRRLRPADAAAFSGLLVSRVREARTSIEEFEAMAGDGSPLPDRLRDMVLMAEGRRFLGREAGALSFLRAVDDMLEAEFAKVGPPADLSVTLTSHGGVIPVTVRSETGYPVRLRVVLRASRLEFLDGAEKEIVLSGEAHSLTFPVRAQTTGRFPVEVLVETPAGREIAQSQIVVRSTAYNRVALLFTVGAALFLALGWGRRLLRRHRT